MLQGDSYREILAKRDFRRLWVGYGLAQLGRSIIYVAVALYVHELTGSAREISFAIALELLPWVIVGPLAGLLADRAERKKVLVVAYLLQGTLTAMLPLTTNLGQIYALVFLRSVLAPVAQLVRAAALPTVTGEKLFLRGSSLDIVAFNVVNVIGPPLAGLLVSLTGVRTTFLIAVACFLGATLSALGATIPSPAATQRGARSIRTVWNDLREGARRLIGSPILRYLVLFNFIASGSWAIPSVGGVVYVSDVLGMGAQAYGLLEGVAYLSMALGAFVLGRYTSRLPRQRLLVGGAFTAGLGLALVLTRPGFPLLLVLWLIGGAGRATHWLVDSTLWAENTPDEIRGRVYSLATAVVYLVEIGATTIGGWLINTLGVIGGLGIVGGTISVTALGAAALAGGFRTVGSASDESDQV